MGRAVAMFVGVLLLIDNVAGQPRMDREEGPQFIFFEPVNLASTDPGRSRVDIPYRINQGFFIPVRNTDPSISSAFKRRGEISIELLDSTGTSAARDISRFEAGVESSEETLERSSWYQNIVSFDVPPGTYKLIIELDDLESERKFLSNKTAVVARAFGSSFEVSTPVFVEWPPTEDVAKPIILQNWGRDLQFGKRAALLFVLNSEEQDDQPVRIEYTISVKARPDDLPVQIVSDTLENVTRVSHANLSPFRSDEMVGYDRATSERGRCVSIIMSIGAEQLPLRAFVFTATIIRGGKKATLTKLFRTVWPEMPLSLRDVDYALESLRYIVTEQQRDSLSRGSADERRDHLEQFWQARDKTPETTYNEVQAEYYRRVDHARRAFGTLREPDGSLTDRGRISILFGQPGAINRTLDPSSGFQEEWVYENLNKRFIFADKTKSGNYILVSSQTL